MTAVCLEFKNLQRATPRVMAREQGFVQDAFCALRRIVQGVRPLESLLEGPRQDVGALKIPPPVDHPALRPLRLLPEPTPIHFWGKYLCWDDNVDEAESLENRELVFSEWWENSLERVYYPLMTKKGRLLWLYRTAEGDFLHGEFV